MVRVEVTLTSMLNISFEHSKVFEWDQESWDDMDREQRQAVIDEEAEQFLRDSVEWDYKVL